MIVDWTQVGPRPHLWLYHHPTNQVLPWEILDGDRVYTRAATLDRAVAFMRAAERLGDATVDEDSVEYWRADRVFGGEQAWMRAWKGSGDPIGVELAHGSVSQAERSVEPASSETSGAATPHRSAPDTFSVRVPTNVVPFERKASA